MLNKLLLLLLSPDKQTFWWPWQNHDSLSRQCISVTLLIWSSDIHHVQLSMCIFIGTVWSYKTIPGWKFKETFLKSPYSRLCRPSSIESFYGLDTLSVTDTLARKHFDDSRHTYCHPTYLTYMQITSWEMLGRRKDKLESRLPGELSITSDMQMMPVLWQKVKKNQRASWWKWEESEKVGLNLNIQKTKIMASGPIASWEIDGETASDFILGGSKITADGDWSHEIKTRLLLGRKVMTNPDSIFKSRDITLPTKVCLVKARFFQWSCMDVRVGLWKKLSAEILMLLNCGVGEDSWESLGLQGDPTSPFWRRSALGFIWKEWC